MEQAKEQEDKLDFYDDLLRNAPELGNNELETTFYKNLEATETEQVERNDKGDESQAVDPSKTTVYVGGLGWWFTDEELEQVACDYNQSASLRKALKEIKFCYDPNNGKSTGDAYLFFENSKVAQEAAKALQSHDFGRKVKVELTTEEVAQQDTDWALKKSFMKNIPNRNQGKRNTKGAFEQFYRGQGAAGPIPGNAAHFAQKFPSQGATMSAPPAFPFFTPFGFPAFPGMPNNMAGRGNHMTYSTSANANSANSNSNVPAGRGNHPDSPFFHPGFPPIPPQLFGYPPLSGMPPGSGFPASCAANTPIGNNPLADPSGVQSNMPVSSASSRYTGEKDMEAKEEQSEHPSVVYSKSREARTKQDASQKRPNRDSSKSEPSSSSRKSGDSRSRSERYSKRHSRHEKKRSRYNSDSEDDSLRRDRSSRRKYRSDDHSRDRYEKSSKRSSHEERRGR